MRGAEVHLADGRPRMLHEMSNRAGHTALVIGGLSVQVQALARVDELIRAQTRASIMIEEIVVIAARSRNQSPYARIAPTAAEEWGSAS